jgi:Na+/alanine symporter
MADAIQGLADLLFMPPIVTLLLGTGLFLTIRFRGVQIRGFVKPSRRWSPARPMARRAPCRRFSHS